jgi:putative transposase
LDEGIYPASTSTMNRVLRSRSAIRERRPQARHPVYEAPVLEATGANQVWIARPG